MCSLSIPATYESYVLHLQSRKVNRKHSTRNGLFLAFLCNFHSHGADSNNIDYSSAHENGVEHEIAKNSGVLAEGGVPYFTYKI